MQSLDEYLAGRQQSPQLPHEERHSNDGGAPELLHRGDIRYDPSPYSAWASHKVACVRDAPLREGWLRESASPRYAEQYDLAAQRALQVYSADSLLSRPGCAIPHSCRVVVPNNTVCWGERPDLEQRCRKLPVTYQEWLTGTQLIHNTGAPISKLVGFRGLYALPHIGNQNIIAFAS